MPSLSGIIQSPLALRLDSAWRWWIEELRACVPHHLKRGSRPTATSELWLSAETMRVDRVADGVGERFAEQKPIERLDAEGWQQLAELIDGTRARIVLSPPDVYTTTVTLPKAARSRLRSAVMLQLGEVSPLDPTMLCWSIHNVRVIGDQIMVQITMAIAQRLDQLVALFTENDLPTPPIMAAVEGNFVQLRAGGDLSRKALGKGRRAMLFAVGLAASIPLTTIVGASILTAANHRASERLEEAVRPKLEAEKRARDAERLRIALSPLSARAPVSNIFNDLAGRLPASAWIRTIGEQPDGTIEFEIDAAEPDLARAALADDPILPDVQEIEQSPIDDGRTTVRFLAKRQ